MKLLVIVLCLLSERFLIHAFSYQRFAWFAQYEAFINNKLPQRDSSIPSAIQLLLILLPVWGGVALIYCLLHHLFWGLTGFVLNLIIFFYIIGPSNPFYPLSTTDADPSKKEVLIGDYFAAVNHQLFAVIFWYALAGPLIALLYRLISLAQDSSKVGPLAQKLTQIIEWIPARLTALLYLLAGNLQAGLAVLSSFLWAKPDQNSRLLSACGLAAMNTNEANQPVMPAAETLVEHAVVILLVMLALFTL